MQEHIEVVKSLDGYIKSSILPRYMKTPEEMWQPSDLLPDLTQEDWRERLAAFRAPAAAIPDGTLIVLVGNTLTEEALPTYMSMLNRYEGIKDATGASDDGWARWTRQWTAEEARHDDVLQNYLLLSGRVNLRAIEETKQHLIRNGFDPGAGPDPYAIIAYTCVQEPATQTSHNNVAKLAKQAGDSSLAKICGLVASDERRHAAVYQEMMREIIRIDQQGLVALKEMVRKGITMPAERMPGGLFAQFSRVGQQTGMYTASDYARIVDAMVKTMGIADFLVDGEAAKAQEYLCTYAQRFERIKGRMGKIPDEPQPFAWIFGRKA